MLYQFRQLTFVCMVRRIDEDERWNRKGKANLSNSLSGPPRRAASERKVCRDTWEDFSKWRIGVDGRRVRRKRLLGAQWACATCASLLRQPAGCTWRIHYRKRGRYLSLWSGAFCVSPTGIETLPFDQKSYFSNFKEWNSKPRPVNFNGLTGNACKRF